MSILINDVNKPVLGSLNPSVTYKEPIDHIASIAQTISNLMSGDSFNIVSTGPKNNHMINYLLELNPNSCISEHGYRLSAHKSARTILLMTRIIEHINSYAFLDDLLSRSKYGDVLYVEILDFISLFFTGNLSFLWNERVTYPSKEFLVRFLAHHHYFPYDMQNISKPEPFHSLVLIKQPNYPDKSLPILHSLPTSAVDIRSIHQLIHDRMSDIATRFNTISIYGVGHKSLTLVDFIQQSNSEVGILLYDGSEHKVDCYYKDIKIKALNFTSISITFNSLHIFSFDGPFAHQLRDYITNRDPSCSFATVNSLMYFNDACQKDQ